MKNHRRRPLVTRDGFLKMLSDEEVASVSRAETVARLRYDEEYVDLQRLDRGVQRARGGMAGTGRVLPRNAVHASTWAKIMACVSGLQRALLN